MLEYEKKISLTEDEYLRLLSSDGEKKLAIIQTNHYYDTDDLKMNMQGITYRIREKHGKYKATIKAHKIENKECSIEKTKDALNKYDDQLFSGMHIKLQGSLTTERVVLYSGDGCEVVLDKNTYLGMTDYELEVEYLPEYEDNATKIMHHYFCMHTLSLKQSKSKSERFFERKKQLSFQEKET